MIREIKTVIVGGGPAGLAAAISAYDAGERSLLIIERDKHLGGILQQCIHNGFGLQWFKEELTGPEYAQRFVDQVRERGIESRLGTMVLEIQYHPEAKDGYDKTVLCLSPDEGVLELRARSVVMAMGCRERVRGNLKTPGTRPVGIYSAGLAQKLVNLEGVMPGKEVVILGSGDIGLIMARRMKWEGANVKMVLELMPYSAGLARNIQQCLIDQDIPLHLSTTVIDIHGTDRLRGVTIAKVDENRKVIPGTEQEVACDTLLLSVGLLPETELAKSLDIRMDPVTGSVEVDEDRQTSVPGLYACGNVLHVHDIVDFVTKESMIAGKAAAHHAAGNEDNVCNEDNACKTDNACKQDNACKTDNVCKQDNACKTENVRKSDIVKIEEQVKIDPKGPVRYTVPQRSSLTKPFTIYCRVASPLDSGCFVLEANGQEILTKRFIKAVPASMAEIAVTQKDLERIKEAGVTLGSEKSLELSVRLDQTKEA